MSDGFTPDDGFEPDGFAPEEAPAASSRLGGLAKYAGIVPFLLSKAGESTKSPTQWSQKVGEGMLPGFNRVGAALQAATDPLVPGRQEEWGPDFGTRYAEHLRAEQGQSAQTQAEHPLVSAGLQTAGAVPSAIAMGAPAGVVPTAIGGGAMYGAGETRAETVGGQLLDTGIGAGAGAASLAIPPALLGAENAVRSVADRVLPRVTATPAARVLLNEGVPLTVGQIAGPNSKFGQVEAASAKLPFGMAPEREAAERGFMRVAQDKGVAPGAQKPAETDLQRRLKALFEGFGPAYDKVRDQPIPREAVEGMQDAAANLPGGIDARTRGKVQAEIDNALTVLPEEARPSFATRGRLPMGDTETASVTRPVPLPKETGLPPIDAPEWLDPAEFLANRQAWEWTWAATGGPGAPEQTQKLVFQYMRRAFETAPAADVDFAFGANAAPPVRNDFPIKQGLAAARLMEGKGGRKFEPLREKLRLWAAQPEAERDPDPITNAFRHDPWGGLIDTTRYDREMVENSRGMFSQKKYDAMEKWLRRTREELDPVARRYEAAAGEEPPPSPYKAGDLMKVRENIREQIRAARQSQDFDQLRLLEHAEDVITGAIDGNLTPELQQLLRETDRQYARLMTAANASPGGQTGFTPLQYLKQVEKGAGRRAFKTGGAGDLQDLGESARETFVNAPMTGWVKAFLGTLPWGEKATGPLSSMMNSPSGRALLLRHGSPRLPNPGAPPPAAGSPARAGASAISDPMRRFIEAYGVRGGMGGAPAAAEEDSR